MKIVVCYDIDGGYDCPSIPKVLCFEYESTGAWLVGFEAVLNRCKKGEWKHTLHEFRFCGHTFTVEDFCFRREHGWSAVNMLPDVFELNEWFDKRVGNND